MIFHYTILSQKEKNFDDNLQFTLLLPTCCRVFQSLIVPKGINLCSSEVVQQRTDRYYQNYGTIVLEKRETTLKIKCTKYLFCITF